MDKEGRFIMTLQRVAKPLCMEYILRAMEVFMVLYRVSFAFQEAVCTRIRPFTTEVCKSAHAQPSNTNFTYPKPSEHTLRMPEERGQPHVRVDVGSSQGSLWVQACL